MGIGWGARRRRRSKRRRRVGGELEEEDQAKEPVVAARSPARTRCFFHRAGTGGIVEAAEKKEKGERRDKKALTCEPQLHVSSKLAKPPFKTCEWPNENDFDSWMVEDS